MKPEHKLTLSMLGLQRPEPVMTDRRYRPKEVIPKLDMSKFEQSKVEDPRKPSIHLVGEGKPKRKPLKFKL